MLFRSLFLAFHEKKERKKRRAHRELCRKFAFLHLTDLNHWRRVYLILSRWVNTALYLRNAANLRIKNDSGTWQLSFDNLTKKLQMDILLISFRVFLFSLLFLWFFHNYHQFFVFIKNRNTLNSFFFSYVNCTLGYV